MKINCKSEMFVHVRQMNLFKLYKKELIFHKNELY